MTEILVTVTDDGSVDEIIESLRKLPYVRSARPTDWAERFRTSLVDTTKTAEEAGLSEMTMEEIVAEIKAMRREAAQSRS